MQNFTKKRSATDHTAYPFPATFARRCLRVRDACTGCTKLVTAALYDYVALSTLIRIKRLQWAGYVIRMVKERIPRRAFEGHYGGRRMVGRPLNRWEDMVQEDEVNLLGIRTGK